MEQRRQQMSNRRSKIGGWGVSPTGKSFRFVSFVRACVHAVWLPSGIRSQKWPIAFPFSPLPFRAFPFPFPPPTNLLFGVPPRVPFEMNYIAMCCTGSDVMVLQDLGGEGAWRHETYSNPCFYCPCADWLAGWLAGCLAGWAGWAGFSWILMTLMVFEDLVS